MNDRISDKCFVISDRRLVICDKRFVTSDKIQTEEQKNKRLGNTPFRIKNLFFCSSVLKTCLLLFLLSSCERREVTYYMESEIELYIDWGGSGLDGSESGYGATVLFFPRDGGAPRTVLMGDRGHETVRLPEGLYDVIAFNRSFTDFSMLAFRGEQYSGLEAYIRAVGSGDETLRGVSRVVTGSPEKLAAASLEGFEVTEEMLGNYAVPSAGNSGNSGAPVNPSNCPTESCTIRLSPCKLTREVRVQVNVKGLNNVREMVCTLSGMPESVRLSSGEVSPATVSQQFSLEDAAFTDGSPFDGMATGEFNTFGFETGKTARLKMKALLVDGKTVVEEDFEVTARELSGEDGTLILYIEVTAAPMPEVKPDNGSDSGFDAEVGEWGDEEDVDIDTRHASTNNKLSIQTFKKKLR